MFWGIDNSRLREALFPTIEEMLKNGRATVILALGALTEVTADRITYTAQTAHLFEQAQAVGVIASNENCEPREVARKYV